MKEDRIAVGFASLLIVALALMFFGKMFGLWN